MPRRAALDALGRHPGNVDLSGLRVTKETSKMMVV